MSITCDVLVIGGGPAGLATALLLSKKGFSTVVLEKGKTGGPKHTKYDITEGNRIREILEELGVKPNKISSISEWISPNHNFILDSEIEDFYFKRGPEGGSLENMLMGKLNDDNVKIFFKSKVDSIEREGKEIVSLEIEADAERLKIKPRYVIVADGPESEFTKRLNIKARTLATFNGFGVLLKSNEIDSIPHAKIYFDKDIAPGGYLYSGSVGNESFFCIVYDAIFSKKNSLKHDLKSFLKQNMQYEFTVKNYFSGMGISGIQDVTMGNTMFVGGAGLFCDPFFGYGLNYAIESAYYAAKSIEENNTKIFHDYSNKIQNELSGMYFARDIWRKADNDFFDRLLMAFNGKYDTDDENINKIIELFGENSNSKTKKGRK